MISLDFGDKTRTLAYDLSSIRDLENAMGGQPISLVIQQVGQLGVNALVFALWAGLKHDDRGLTPKLTEKYLSTYIKERRSKAELGQKINDALEETGLFRSDDEDAEGKG